jgi:DNA transposition AAA+ family ATPase
MGYASRGSFRLSETVGVPGLGRTRQVTPFLAMQTHTYLGRTVPCYTACMDGLVFRNDYGRLHID